MSNITLGGTTLSLEQWQDLFATQGFSFEVLRDQNMFDEFQDRVIARMTLEAAAFDWTHDEILSNDRGWRLSKRDEILRWNRGRSARPKGLMLHSEVAPCTVLRIAAAKQEAILWTRKKYTLPRSTNDNEMVSIQRSLYASPLITQQTLEDIYFVGRLVSETKADESISSGILSSGHLSLWPHILERAWKKTYVASLSGEDAMYHMLQSGLALQINMSNPVKTEKRRSLSLRSRKVYYCQRPCKKQKLSMTAPPGPPSPCCRCPRSRELRCPGAPRAPRKGYRRRIITDESYDGNLITLATR